MHTPLKKTKTHLPLSPVQEKIWGFILSYLADTGYSPTLGEIAQRMSKVREHTFSRQAVQYNLDEMERKGKLTRTGGVRGIKIITK